ncbi:MAG: nucleotidyltransferase family protein [Sedimentisphaerales bacterium]|nr:nucleotidyltransferase family protein [Sedimentisphaerales bacterium]
MLSVEDIRKKRGEILKVARQHGADNVRIFGSVLHNQADEGSDLDLLVTMAPDKSLLDRIALMHALEDLLQVKVDVVNEKALHPSIRDTVMREGVAL